MRNKLLFVLLIFSTAAHAQVPTLTSACNPQPGDVHQQFFTDTFLQGPAGAALTWHFDTLHNYGSDTVYISPCSASPYCADFPGTDVNEYFSDNTTAQYYHTTAGALSFTGYYNAVPIPYRDSEDLLRYPFTYGDTYTDTFSGSFYISPYAYGRLGYVTITADAYGILILPNAVYPNALRVHLNETYVDSGNSGGTPYRYTYSQNSYVWYVPGARTEVLAIGRILGPSGLTVNSYYTSAQPDALPQVQKGLAEITLYPNPACDHVTIIGSFDTESRADICDLTGKLLSSYSLHGTNAIVPVSQLRSGTYQCRIYAADGKMTVKRLVVTR